MPGFPSPRDFPFSLEDLRGEFDRLLDRFWHGGLTTAPLDGQDWAPPMDVVELPDAYRIRLEVPGVAPEDVDVSILSQELTVRGRKTTPQGTDEGHRLRGECRFGTFCRRFELPLPVDDTRVIANCRQGVLEITVPKAVQAKGHSVRVETKE